MSKNKVLMTLCEAVVSFLLEKALKELPVGTTIQAEDWEIERWLASEPEGAQLELSETQAPEGFQKQISARLRNDPRARTTKRKFDLEG